MARLDSLNFLSDGQWGAGDRVGILLGRRPDYSSGWSKSDYSSVTWSL